MAKVKAYGILLYKIQNESIKVLLCKSVKSLDRWGCLKGVILKGESSKECAKREFKEECGITVPTFIFEKYFSQENDEKDIGVWIVNANKIEGIDSFFSKDKLLDNYLSWENSKVKFFDIKDLPKIKKKQSQLVSKIKGFLENMNRHH
ncbi:NUDIX hydrolase [Arcobacter sp. CECT 8983]|uniref:NUDIX domain-containing protein n=1 Tax=Arcobacter sp. CECT 8983 TaxID=2044508 RepID=UPI00100AA12B|nr:NUDIX domain-containing protein [Arcobacter sp. CECT 8983]RXJ88809.1 NUDIX hydrolase [Arcobacter sp. CECT 8983]